MIGIIPTFGKVALAAAALAAASLSFAGEAQAKFEGPGVYVIKSAHQSRKVLDIDNGPFAGNSSGRKLYVYDSNGGQNQKFIIFADGNGFIIRPLHSLLCLRFQGNHPGGKLVQSSCNGRSSRRFRIGTEEETIIGSHNGKNALFAKEGAQVVLDKPDPTNPRIEMLFEFSKQ